MNTKEGIDRTISEGSLVLAIAGLLGGAYFLGDYAFDLTPHEGLTVAFSDTDELVYGIACFVLYTAFRELSERTERLIERRKENSKYHGGEYR